MSDTYIIQVCDVEGAGSVARAGFALRPGSWQGYVFVLGDISAGAGRGSDTVPCH